MSLVEQERDPNYNPNDIHKLDNRFDSIGKRIKGRFPPIANPREATVNAPTPTSVKNKSSQIFSATNVTPCYMRNACNAQFISRLVGPFPAFPMERLPGGNATLYRPEEGLTCLASELSVF